jgi:hypothetical protein
MLLTVYRMITLSKTFVGMGVRCQNWREANRVRSDIAKAALVAKDGSTSVTYNEMGEFVVEGWQK